MKPMFIKEIEWEKADISKASDPSARMPGHGRVTVDDLGLFFRFDLSPEDNKVIYAILQVAAARALRNKLE